MLEVTSNSLIAAGLFSKSPDAQTFEKADAKTLAKYTQEITPKQGTESIKNAEIPQKIQALQVTAIASSTFSEMLRTQEIATQPEAGKSTAVPESDRLYLVLGDTDKQAGAVNNDALDRKQVTVAAATAALHEGIETFAANAKALHEMNAENGELLTAYRFLIDYREPGTELDFVVSEQGNSLNLERIVNGQSNGSFSTQYPSVKEAILSHFQSLSDITERSRQLGLIP